MAEILGRTIGSSMQGADKVNDDHSPFMPQPPICLAPAVRNVTQISATTPIGLGRNNVRFEIPKTEGDKLSKIWLVGEFNALPTPAGGTATKARWCDYVGYNQIKEMRIRYATTTLQTIRKEDLFVYHQLMLDDAAQAREDTNIHGNVPPPRRDWEAKARLFFKVPIHLAFFQDDMCKSLDVQGLTQKLMVEIDFEPASQLIQVNGTSNNVFLSDSSAYYNYLYLQAEVYHVMRKERDQGIAMMSAPDGVRLLFDNTQWHTQSKLDSTTALDGTVQTFELKNLSAPTKFLVFLLRWVGDLTRTSGASGPSDNFGTNGVMGGADYFNIAGWMAPLLTAVPDTAGPAVPLITHIAIKTGNNYILRKTPIQEIINDYQGRWFK